MYDPFLRRSLRASARIARAGVLAAAVAFVATPRAAGAQGRKPPTNDETLLLADIPSVFGASRFDQAVTEAPASVTVITAEDIATYGWRSLAELLRSVRGFYVTDDRSYSYVGTRGFGRLGDYNTRLLILVDGVRFNENVYDGGYVGTEGVVDMSIVDRVEVIRGPASSLYGTNAFLGIVSVSTVRGRARGGVQVGGSAESFGTHEVSLSAGRRLLSGIDLFVSGRSRRSDGRDFTFAEFADADGGRAVGIDADRRDNAFAKAEWGPLTISAMVNLRHKQMPTAPYGVDFGDGRMAYTDNVRNLALRYHRNGQDGSTLSATLSATRYDYQGTYPYGPENYVEWSHGRWGVAEAQYSRHLGASNRVVFGAMYNRNARQEQQYGGGVPFQRQFDDNTTADTWALFGLAESRLGRHLIANAGLRRDYASWLGANWNPHAGLIWKFDEGSAAKLLFGRAFRAPNNYERFYSDNEGTQKANPSLDAEHVSTLELLVERRISRQVKGNVSWYRYAANGLIDRWDDPTDGLLQFRNIGHVDGTGVEGELEVDFGRVTGRGSYALQRSRDRDTAERLSNSPTHLAMLNVSAPIVAERLGAGVEVRGMGARAARDGGVVAGHVVVNTNLATLRPVHGVRITLGIRNVLDRRYGDPVAEEYAMRTMLQDPRAFRLSMTWGF